MQTKKTLSLNPTLVKDIQLRLKKQEGTLSGLVNYLLSEWLRLQKSIEFSQKQFEELSLRKIKELKKRKTKPLSIEEEKLLKILLETLSDSSHLEYKKWMIRNIKKGRHTNPKN